MSKELGKYVLTITKKTDGYDVQESTEGFTPFETLGALTHMVDMVKKSLYGESKEE